MLPVNSIYIGHGAPLNAMWETSYSRNLEQFASNHSRPSAIVVVSAHFERDVPLQITSADRPGIIYDYYGFPEEMYELEYDAPGDPKLATSLANTLSDAGRNPTLNSNQGLDHGAWIPLRIMYPKADVPILQLSIPVPRNPKELYRIGQELSSYRENDVMFMGSGNLVHNLPHAFSKVQQFGHGIDGFKEMPTEDWAVEVDNWLKEKLDDRATEDLLNASHQIENFHFAAPTTEHFDPLYFFLGTMSDREGINYIHEGFEGGSISMRSFASEE